MDHANVSDRCIVKVTRNDGVIKKIIEDEEWEKEKEQASNFLAKEFIKIILSKGEKNDY